MRWWETRKHILVREKSKCDEAFPDNNFEFEIRGDDLWITGTILGFFEFESKYPPSYPSAPPDIFPKDRYPRYVPGHQFKSSRFCLDIREKTWCSRLTVADIIKSLQTLLIAKCVKEVTKSDKLPVYEEPEPDELDHIQRNKRCIMPADLMPLPSIGKYGQFNYVYHFKRNHLGYIITDLIEGDNKRNSSWVGKIWWKETLCDRNKGLWLRASKALFSKLLFINDAEAISKDIKEYAEFPENFKLEEYFKANSYWKLLVFADEYQSIPFLLNYNSEKKKITRHGIYILDLNGLAARIPNKEKYDMLKHKKVCIIGCGAGGSKDAEYLVKSGITKFILIDDDTLQTENILRHGCHLDYLSIEKVYAVEEKIKMINPDAEVKSIRKHLEIIDAATDEQMRDSDLIIVDTGSNENLFNEYAFAKGIPAIYPKVYPMGFGGEIIRIIPGLTPCFECSHESKEVIIEETFKNAQFPEIETVSYDTLSNGTNMPIPALAADSDFISLICVRMALEVLTTEDPRSLADSPHIRLWGNKKEWIFDEEFQSLSINNDKVRSFQNCIVCYGNSVIENEIGKTQDQIDAEFAGLISEIKGAAGGKEDSDS